MAPNWFLTWMRSPVWCFGMLPIWPCLLANPGYWRSTLPCVLPGTLLLAPSPASFLQSQVISPQHRLIVIISMFLHMLFLLSWCLPVLFLNHLLFTHHVSRGPFPVHPHLSQLWTPCCILWARAHLYIVSSPGDSQLPSFYFSGQHSHSGWRAVTYQIKGYITKPSTCSQWYLLFEEMTFANSFQFHNSSCNFCN